MADLSGLRVLVVEDEGTVAFLIESMLEEMGCELAASVARLPRAIEAANSIAFDLALLDVNVGGQPVFPLARTLMERNTPFVLCTGYGADGVPEDMNRQVVLAKPFLLNDLRRAISRALAVHAREE